VPAPLPSDLEASLDQWDQFVEVVALPARFAANAVVPPVRVEAAVALGHDDDRREAFREALDVAALGVRPGVVGVADAMQEEEDGEAALAVVAVRQQHVRPQLARVVVAVPDHGFRIDVPTGRGDRDQLGRLGGRGRCQQDDEKGQDHRHRE
jgi:hypothetical protein